ncbi:MAG: hypothetical protein ACI9P7_001554, partial [Candidatus Azotimanducaceae bacterium]
SITLTPAAPYSDPSSTSSTPAALSPSALFICTFQLQPGATNNRF